jgi:multicomponent Na+:H+ antiporter subunit G
VILGWIVCGLAMTILLIAALGVYRLPDALARQHAATKAGTLSLVLFALGTGLLAWDGEWNGTWAWRLLVLVLILVAVLPLASHALARAAVAREPR